MLENGPLFLENRYTDWHRYWPHHTLRNLWMLSKYLPPQRLRIEFLNTARNREKYNHDPLAPAKYTPDYLFATTMLASPLGWFEVSHLSPQYVEKVAKLVAIWKQHREAIYSGQTLPIGEAPDGTSWTGFIAGDPDGVAYALVFRELNDRAEATFATGFLGKKNYRSTLLAGEGNVEFKSGTLHAQIESPLHYAFVQLAPA
jgi:alpha-galactosidase